MIDAMINDAFAMTVTLILVLLIAMRISIEVIGVTEPVSENLDAMKHLAVQNAEMTGDLLMANMRDDSLQGSYRMKGVAIDFAGESGEGADPLDIIKMTIHRLEFEQTTGLASNSKAKALTHMLQARDSLLGTDETMEDGTRIIK